MTTALIPHLTTRRVALSQGGPEAGRLVYEFLMEFGMTALGDPETFSAAIGSDVVALFVVTLRSTGKPVGFGLLQNLSPAGHVEIGIYTHPDRTPIGAGAEATVLLVNYAFAALGVRKVYSVTTELSRDGFGVAFDMGCLEATLPEHLYFQGELWDAYYFSVEEQEWRRTGALFLEQLLPKNARAGGQR